MRESVNLFCEIVIRIYYLFETNISKQFVEHCKRLSYAQLQGTTGAACNCLMLEQLKEFYDMFTEELFCSTPTDVFEATTIAGFNKVLCKTKIYKSCIPAYAASACYKVDLYDTALAEDKTWGYTYNMLDTWQIGMSKDERHLLFLKICFSVYLVNLKKQDLLAILKTVLEQNVVEEKAELFKLLCSDCFDGALYLNVIDSVKLAKVSAVAEKPANSEDIAKIVDFVQEFCNMLSVLEENKLYWCCDKRKYLKLLLADSI